MAKLIQQSVVLSASPRELYSMYLSAKAHGAITKHGAHIGSRPGSRFSAFNGALKGRILQTIPGRLIVQSWRSTAFRKSDPDSTLILRFTGRAGKGRIDLVHANVPDHDYRNINHGWKQYYWKPWRKYLSDHR